MIPVFIYEAVTAASVCSLLQTGSSLNCYLDSNAELVIGDYDQLMEAAVLLASLLECHYSMRPSPSCGDFQPHIQAAIDWFKVHEIITEEESKGVVRGTI